MYKKKKKKKRRRRMKRMRRECDSSERTVCEVESSEVLLDEIGRQLQNGQLTLLRIITTLRTDYSTI